MPLRHFRDDTCWILDGEIRLYRRERSRRWQAAFTVDGKSIRVSTGKRDLNDAKEFARDTYLEYKFRHEYFLHPKSGNLQEVSQETVHIYRLSRKLYTHLTNKHRRGSNFPPCHYNPYTFEFPS